MGNKRKKGLGTQQWLTLLGAIPVFSLSRANEMENHRKPLVELPAFDIKNEIPFRVSLIVLFG